MSDIRKFLQNQRTQYDMGKLDIHDLSANPLELFKTWFNDAIAKEVMEVNAMNLATVDSNGQPSNRVVLLKGVDENGFIFFTNYKSRKAREIAQNPHAAVNFFWAELARQVRVEGILQKISEKESDEYFLSRPRLSQLGALASAQSDIIENREMLEEQLAALDKKYLNAPIPRPTHWGGYALIPHRIEFWQGRANRLHDRILYKLESDATWKKERLSP